MTIDVTTTFTGITFPNPFLLSSAPPTESESNILRAFEAGWGGVVTKTIGLHPVVNVYGAKAKFMRTSPDTATVSMKKRPDAALHSSWNWELISDKPLDWWEPRIRRIKDAFPDRVLIASIMAGSGNDKELGHWQTLAKACQEAGADGLELNFSCPHMDRKDMGSNIGKDQGLCSVVTEAVKEVRHRTGVVQAHAGDRRHRGRGGCLFPRRCRRDRVVQYLPVAAVDRSGDAGVRDQRRRLRFQRRTRRAGDSSAGARQDGAADHGVSGPEFFRHRRYFRHVTGAELLPARLRHGAGVHGRHARPRDRAQRHPASQPAVSRVSREARVARLALSSRTSGDRDATASCFSRRFAGPIRRTTTRATTSSRATPRPTRRRRGPRDRHRSEVRRSIDAFTGHAAHRSPAAAVHGPVARRRAGDAQAVHATRRSHASTRNR